MSHRRSFIKQISAAGLLSILPNVLLAEKVRLLRQQNPSGNLIWANLLHLSYNMWEDHIPDPYIDESYQCNTCMDARLWAHGYRPNLTFDDDLWDDLLKAMASAGMNMVVMDLGDGVQYESHPEIAVNNAWTTVRLRKELRKMRTLGLEPIPKLNFATTHDAWLGEYSRMVSTRKYYEVCRDLIEEVVDLFGKPRFFHLGMDEETAAHQERSQKYMVVRKDEVWWGDFYFLIGEIEKNGVRPWIWSDYVWHHPDIFFKKMPGSVLQSNWYYGDDFGAENESVKYYDELDRHGYDQVPTGSNHSNPVNFELTVDFCKKAIDPDRLFGFIMAPWRPTLMPCSERHREAIGQVARAIHNF